MPNFSKVQKYEFDRNGKQTKNSQLNFPKKLKATEMKIIGQERSHENMAK